MKLIRWLHQVLGALLAPFFVLWFVSAFVMLFAGFPRANRAVQDKLKDPVGVLDSLPAPQLLIQHYGQEKKTDTVALQNLSVTRERGVLSYALSGSKGRLVFDERLQAPSVTSPDEAFLKDLSMRLVGQNYVRIDTLKSLDQWVPFSQREKDLPFYRLCFNDAAKTKVYVSSRDGSVLQLTTQKNKLLALLGAIPHWLYIKPLRMHIDLWVNVIIVLSILGCIMLIAGLVLGFRYTLLSRGMRRPKWTPYRKKWYRWHHLYGLVFFLPMLTWLFSGWMSLDELPQWLTGPRPAAELRSIDRSDLNVEDADFVRLSALYPDALELSCEGYMGQNVFSVRDADTLRYLMYKDGTFVPFHLDLPEVQAYLQKKLPNTKLLQAEELDHYVSEYVPHPRSKRARYSLPVYRFQSSHERFYVAADRPYYRVCNKATAMSDWAYRKLHTFSFVWAYHHPTLWLIVMILLLTGGTIVSISGIALSWKFWRRAFRRKKKRRKHS